MTRRSLPRAELIPGTLDLLILKTLSVRPLHGYGIAQQVQRLSDDVLRVEEGSLYPALQRLQLRGVIKSRWEKSPTGRRARYYELTARGRRQLKAELSSFERTIAAIRAVLRPAT
ncbi:MAG TPA: PadR family transcriptional regulator [Gemmatimonadales bacterium]|nr:PadR family transcriptional regulator [Gemmatimonadales bacterium]